MFLKRIDMVGFKSFADRTGIDFSSGITAVVGPNGSGKSNIADAVRWVLGEQSARSLRGNRMEDVIFAGSESRKAVNFCEVSLTLDNGDHHLLVPFDEVSVTRRMYRSGEGEYFLNKQPCRLKDITEVFMDSGIGRESYSIIGQGRIEEMLSTRPEDRRGPFEDAAGIVKYKYRRREAERKLEQAASNMVRVDDILVELSVQADPLRVQAEKALAYQEIVDLLGHLEMGLLLVEIQRMKSGLAEAVSDTLIWMKQRDEQQTALLTARASFESARETLAVNVEAQANTQQLLLSAVEARQRTEGQLHLWQERVQVAQAGLVDKSNQVAALVEELDQLAVRKNQQEQRLANITTSLTINQKQLQEAVQTLDLQARANLEALISTVNESLIDHHQAAANRRNEHRAWLERLQGGKTKVNELQTRKEEWLRRADALTVQIGQSVGVLQERSQQVATLQQDLAEGAAILRELSHQEANVGAQFQRQHAQIAGLSSRIEVLQELEKEFDGYAMGTRGVLRASAKGQLVGIHGAVAGVLQVPPELETAIETALGAAAQNIVTADEGQARAAIEWLKQHQGGRATFMPLSIIRARFLTASDLARVEQLPGFLGVAADVVNCEIQYKNIVGHLLGQILLAETLAEANLLAKALSYHFRIVTRAGDVVYPGGVMSGGSKSNRGVSLLGRKREIQELLQQLISLRADEQSLMDTQKQLREQTAIIQDQQSKRSRELEKMRAQKAGFEAELVSQQRELENTRDRIDALEDELDQVTSDLEQGQAKLQSANSAVTAAAADIANLEQQLRQRRRELQDWDEHLADAREVLTQLRVRSAELAREKESLAGTVVEHMERYRTLSQQRDTAALAMTQLQNSLAEAQNQVYVNEQDEFQMSNQVADLQDSLADLAANRVTAEGALSQAERVLQQTQQSLAETNEQLHRRQVQVERLDSDLNHRLTMLGETYRMTFEWALAHHTLVVDELSAKQQVKDLRQRRDALGEVQLSAIEEWRRLSDRIDFLQRERSDLVLGKSQLETVIRDIDKEMSRRFAETFEQIRQEFQVTFRQLFGGGKANLTLTDSGDVLSAGIEVMAEPPGKKLQNLNLLSGGERALTAMALLFAILRVRPVPFCVLDEVEAALDEANVTRFAQQLRRFAEETQFIVITHRRGTMEDADVLYGVTMQEFGVSTLIGVRLIEDSGIVSA
ncbi:chromosome segregation protein SMC [Alicyclobacillaceae bacterium I2511]|nr:chromosome segregation protein SMC [Alicyclobacillaceae bacterium I2511]